jgi:hypothetical protein
MLYRPTGANNRSRRRGPARRELRSRSKATSSSFTSSPVSVAGCAERVPLQPLTPRGAESGPDRFDSSRRHAVERAGNARRSLAWWARVCPVAGLAKPCGKPSRVGSAPAPRRTRLRLESHLPRIRDAAEGADSGQTASAPPRRVSRGLPASSMSSRLPSIAVALGCPTRRRAKPLAPETRNPAAAGLLRFFQRVPTEGPYGIRTRAAAVRGRCPRPLDEWAGGGRVADARPRFGAATQGAGSGSRVSSRSSKSRRISSPLESTVS